MTAVYWIHQPDNSDIFSQGYVGVSNEISRRFLQHQKTTQKSHFANAIKKHGWDNLVKKVVLVADEDYCLDIEKKLRPTDNVGWNMVAGGGLPPKLFGNKINLGRVSGNKGKKLPCPSKMKGIPRTEELKQKLRKLVTCPNCNKTGGLGGMSRHHFDNCKGGSKPFKARVTIAGERIYIGVFKTKEEAKMAEINYRRTA